MIVSTALTDDREVLLRVRDTGAGMSEPFSPPCCFGRGSSSITSSLMPPEESRLAAKSMYFLQTFKARVFPAMALLQSCKLGVHISADQPYRAMHLLFLKAGFAITAGAILAAVVANALEFLK